MPKGETPPHLQKWLDHVNAYRKKHPEKSYKEALKCAACTFKKK